MNLAALVLAAGAARRFGDNKLSAALKGKPLIHHAIAAARAAPVAQVIVVARPGLEIGHWAGAPEVKLLVVESDALSTSLKAGIAAANAIDGLFVFLGDMPRVPHGLAGRLAGALGDNYAAMPVFGDRPGHPVLLSTRAFTDIAGLTGDEGAGRILRGRKDVVRIECNDPGIHTDIDRPEDLENLEGD